VSGPSGKGTCFAALIAGRTAGCPAASASARVAERLARALPVLLAVLALVGAPSHAAAFDLQGHRGARGLAPENTLAAFERALSIGVTTLELDVGVTRDDVVVIAHDPLLNPDITRDRSGNWLTAKGPAIRALDFADLQAYDVGRIRPDSRYAASHPDQVPVDGARIPALRELFERVTASGNRTVRFNIETKISPLAPSETLEPEPFARQLVAEIRRHGMAGRTTVQSFDWRTLQVVQRIAPEIATVYLSAQQRNFDTVRATDPAGSPWTAGFQHSALGSLPAMVKAAGGAVWSPYFGDIDATQVRAAQALGLRVIPWTINEPDAMRRVIGWGVDGLITDRPDRLRPILHERGIALPLPTR